MNDGQILFVEETALHKNDVKSAIEWFLLHYDKFDIQESKLFQEYKKIPIADRLVWEEWLIKKVFGDVTQERISKQK